MARYIVQMRRGTAAQWKEKSTLIPQEGEIVIELDEENNLHKLKIGDGVHTYAELAYLQAGDEIVTQVLTKAMPRVVTIELASTWTKDADEKYSQVLTFDGITEHSRLDLQPTADMLAEFKKLGLVFVTENNGGTITVYSVGNMPLKAYTMQATIVETECDGGDVPVVGVPVGTPSAQTDWDQNDETKADYVKNRTHWIDFTNEILPAIEVTPFFNSELEIPMGVLGDFSFTVGKKYKVVFDGKEYICEAIMATMEGLSAPAIGNTIVNGGADTGEPFAMFRIADDSTAYSIFFDMNPHTVQIFEEVPHKISTKFVPTLEEMRVEEVAIIPETTIEDSGHAEFLVSESAIPVVADEEYIVNFNGAEYTVKCVDMSHTTGGAPAKLFSLGSYEFPIPDGEPPFGIVVAENVPDLGTMTLVATDNEYEGTSITIGIKHKKPVKIPTKFIPTLEEMRSKFVEIVPLTEFTPSYDSSIGAAIAELNDFELVAGDRYKVTYDGVEYTCEAFKGVINGLPFTAIGNKLLIGGEDTGDPFGVAKITGATFGNVISMDMNPHSVRVEHKINNKIPNEFIPTLEEMRATTGNILEPTTIDLTTEDFHTPKTPLVIGEIYTVYWGTDKYECVATKIPEEVENMFPADSCALGNIAAYLGTGDSGEPFAALYAPGLGLAFVSIDNSITEMRVSVEGKIINKINTKYIDADWMATKDVVTEEIIPPTIIPFENEESSVLVKIGGEPFLEAGANYLVTWQGVKYECIAKHVDTMDLNGIYISNIDIANESMDRAAFGIIDAYNPSYVGTIAIRPGVNAESISVHVQKIVASTINKLPIEYLPDEVLNKPLIGTTAEITPTQVKEAIMAGRPVLIGHLDNTFGLLSCNYFTISESLDTLSTSAVVKMPDNSWYAVEVVGHTSNNTWVLLSTATAEKTDIPDSLSDLTEDASHRTVTDTEKSTWNAKSDFSGSYNDLTDKPTIPTIDGLASKDFVGESVSTHNTSTDSHSDIRGIISGLATRLNALADSDDTTLDQMSEIVAYIKSNKSLIEEITTNKVNVSDIINNLTTNVTNKPLSAAQGVALKALIDAIEIPTALKNPNALTFTGEVTGSYDGSSAKTVNIIGKAGTGNKAERFNNAAEASGEYSHAEGQKTIASDFASHAEGSNTIASSSCSHAEGSDTKAIDFASHAEGSYVIAGGTAAHAEGISDTSTTYIISGAANATTYTGRISGCTVGEIVIYNDITAIITAVDKTAGTITLNKTLSNNALSDVSVIVRVGASGRGSHIEGMNTFASGTASHAEGRQSKATGATAHAEGFMSIAAGDYSHTEGQGTMASGRGAHAEGYNTTASGAQSHAEGNGTIVSHRAQHVQGEYNINDSGSGDSGRGTYAHIVGNGTAYNARSNAHTLDWNGNAWFQGQLKVGGTGQDDTNAKVVATLDDIKIPTALKNPNALTFTGAVTKTYDGSAATTVNIVGKAGTGTKAEVFNYEFNKAVGDYSHAEGNLTYATGAASHAEGQYNRALGGFSHVEGENNSACGSCSHAEGVQTLSYGSFSHTEGAGKKTTSRHLTGAANATVYTVNKLDEIRVGAVYRSNDGTKSAIVKSVNTENNTITLNKTLSETEPYDMYGEFYFSGIALSDCAHSEGDQTIAAGHSQHVQGKYNIIDPDYIANYSHTYGRYAHIVGNGKSETSRSNAHTLDWNGNAWFAGDVYVGSTSGTDKDDGSKKLIAAPTDVVAGDLLMYDGTNWTKISKADLIAEIIATLPNA